VYSKNAQLTKRKQTHLSQTERDAINTHETRGVL
jgi:hypothetical protein